MESRPKRGGYRRGNVTTERGANSGRYIGVLKFKHKYSFGVRYIVHARTFETLLAYVHWITCKQNMSQSVFNPV